MNRIERMNVASYLLESDYLMEASKNIDASEKEHPMVSKAKEAYVRITKNLDLAKEKLSVAKENLKTDPKNLRLKARVTEAQSEFDTLSKVSKTFEKRTKMTGAELEAEDSEAEARKTENDTPSKSSQTTGSTETGSKKIEAAKKEVSAKDDAPKEDPKKAAEKAAKIVSQTAEAKEKASIKSATIGVKANESVDTKVLLRATVYVVRKNGRFITPNSDLGVIPGVTNTIVEVNKVLTKIANGNIPGDMSEKDKEISDKIFVDYPNSKNELYSGKRYFIPNGRVPYDSIDKVIFGVGSFMAAAKDTYIDTYADHAEHWNEILNGHYSEINAAKAEFAAKVDAGLKEKAKLISKIREWCESDYLGPPGKKVSFTFDRIRDVSIKTREKMPKLKSDATPEEVEDAIEDVVKKIAVIDIKQMDDLLIPAQTQPEKVRAHNASKKTKESNEHEDLPVLENYIIEEEEESLTGPLKFSKRLQDKLDAIDNDSSLSDYETALFTLRIVGVTSDDKPVTLYASIGRKDDDKSFINQLFTRFPTFSDLTSYKKQRRISKSAYDLNTSFKVTAEVVSSSKIVRFAVSNEIKFEFKDGGEMSFTKAIESFGSETEKASLEAQKSRKSEFSSVLLDHEPLAYIVQATQKSHIYRGMSEVTVNYKVDGKAKEKEMDEESQFDIICRRIYAQGVNVLKSKSQYLSDKRGDEIFLPMERIVYAIRSKDFEGNPTYFMMGKTKNGDWFTYNMLLADGSKIFNNWPQNDAGVAALPDKLNVKGMGLKTVKPLKCYVVSFGMKDKESYKQFSYKTYARENGIDGLKEAMKSGSVEKNFTGTTKIALTSTAK